MGYYIGIGIDVSINVSVVIAEFSCGNLMLIIDPFVIVFDLVMGLVLLSKVKISVTKRSLVIKLTMSLYKYITKSIIEPVGDALYSQSLTYPCCRVKPKHKRKTQTGAVIILVWYIICYLCNQRVQCSMFFRVRGGCLYTTLSTAYTDHKIGSSPMVPWDPTVILKNNQILGAHRGRGSPPTLAYENYHEHMTACAYRLGAYLDYL